MTASSHQTSWMMRCLIFLCLFTSSHSFMFHSLCLLAKDSWILREYKSSLPASKGTKAKILQTALSGLHSFAWKAAQSTHIFTPFPLVSMFFPTCCFFLHGQILTAHFCWPHLALEMAGSMLLKHDCITQKGCSVWKRVRNRGIRA